MPLVLKNSAGAFLATFAHPDTVPSYLPSNHKAETPADLFWTTPDFVSHGGTVHGQLFTCFRQGCRLQYWFSFPRYLWRTIYLRTLIAWLDSHVFKNHSKNS